jgi:hypothetical protein
MKGRCEEGAVRGRGAQCSGPAGHRTSYHRRLYSLVASSRSQTQKNMWLLTRSLTPRTHSTHSLTHSLTHSPKSIANTTALLPLTVTALPLHDRDAGAALSSLSVHSLTHSLLLACASQYITSPHYLTAPHCTSPHLSAPHASVLFRD